MSTKHVRSAADLVRFSAGLKIDCLSCGNSRTLDGFGAAKACGTKEFAKVQPRLKCSRCGARESKLTVLSPPPAALDASVCFGWKVDIAKLSGG